MWACTCACRCCGVPHMNLVLDTLWQPIAASHAQSLYRGPGTAFNNCGIYSRWLCAEQSICVRANGMQPAAHPSSSRDTHTI